MCENFEFHFNSKLFLYFCVCVHSLRRKIQTWNLLTTFNWSKFTTKKKTKRIIWKIHLIVFFFSSSSLVSAYFAVCMYVPYMILVKYHTTIIIILIQFLFFGINHNKNFKCMKRYFSIFISLNVSFYATAVCLYGMFLFLARFVFSLSVFCNSFCSFLMKLLFRYRSIGCKFLCI